MKKFSLIAIALFLAVAGQAQTSFEQRLQAITSSSGVPAQAAAVPAKDPVNYLIRVEWKEPKADPKSLEVLTTEGQFSLDTIQKTTVKINDSDIPVTLKLSGTLKELSDQKGRLQLFLGRNVPYVSGTYGNGPGARSSSYSQMNVGLQSTFVVIYGKPAVIQADENGEISVLVKRVKD